MSPEEIRAIQERERDATDGPWDWSETADGVSIVFVNSGDDANSHARVLFEADCGGTSDANFIAHARTDVPALLDALHKTESYVHYALRDAHAAIRTFVGGEGPVTIRDHKYRCRKAKEAIEAASKIGDGAFNVSIFKDDEGFWRVQWKQVEV